MMTINRAIEVIDTEIMCVKSESCNKDCCGCALAMEQEEILEAYSIAKDCMMRCDRIEEIYSVLSPRWKDEDG